MIGILDYGSGNLFSISNALKKETLHWSLRPMAAHDVETNEGISDYKVVCTHE